MNKIKRPLTKAITLHDVIDKTTVNGITISRVVFDFDSDCVQVAFGVGNIDAGNYTQIKRQSFNKKLDDFDVVVNITTLQNSVLDHIVSLIAANTEKTI